MLVFINSSLGIYCHKLIIFRNLLLNYIHNIFIHKYVHVNILYNYNIDNKCDCVIVMTHIKDTARDVNSLDMHTPTSVL